jgi:ribosomal protein S27AE
MDEEQRKQIAKALVDRGVNRPCPRCGNTSFSIVDGYFNPSLQRELSGALIIGGPTVPTVITACNRCGFLSQHALGVLGLLPQAPNPPAPTPKKEEG